ncbi:SNF2-related protein [Anoxybacteroides amylolyticum]|uniref:DEAD/DEAH box helicase family protein n=1 Tax=Anoxybacteroides amylolyticum TaxID=294699 RepID=A0A160F6I7_9BACL|nr:DEAD/DEAH box helicase [Anoxybacillus amylolyticus]ANB62136.1 DEAD/DEAH box helicase family protein [Anoxybacillus amylolyticus]
MLYNYQKDTLNKSKPDWLYALDTGTGKTILSIHHYLKHYQGEPLLIVQPPAKLREGGWSREIQRVADYYNIFITYNELSYGKIAKDWHLYKGYFVIFDECHYIKNVSSQRGKAALALTKLSTHFVLLSATPSSNGWIDTINYFLMFRFYKNKTEFLKRHAIYETKHFGDRSVKVISGWKEQQHLKNLYQSVSTKLSKEECLDLPPLVFEDVHFQPSREYKVIQKDRVLETKEGKIAFDTIMKLQHGLRFYANQKDKLAYTEMLAESTVENIVIFYYYQQEKEQLAQLLQKTKTIYEVSGKINKLPSRDEWINLKNTVTFVQYQAGAAGIELQYANIVVFYTPTYSYQDYDQALGRCYRNGQTKKVTVYRYITKNSIEEAVYEALAAKKDFTEELFKNFIGA